MNGVVIGVACLDFLSLAAQMLFAAASFELSGSEPSIDCGKSNTVIGMFHVPHMCDGFRWPEQLQSGTYKAVDFRSFCQTIPRLAVLAANGVQIACAPEMITSVFVSVAPEFAAYT